eukprot:scaffold315943_cov37-Tisochrysis_lutea.AAC.2
MSVPRYVCFALCGDGCCGLRGGIRHQLACRNASEALASWPSSLPHPHHLPLAFPVTQPCMPRYPLATLRPTTALLSHCLTRYSLSCGARLKVAGAGMGMGASARG